MLKYSLYPYIFPIYVLQQTYMQLIKIDGIAFRVGAHTQQGSRKLILNPTGRESHPQV